MMRLSTCHSFHKPFYIERCSAQDRLRNYYSAQGTTLTRSQSVVKIDSEPRSMVVKILSPFLFFIPHAQLERAEMMAIDQYIMSHQWESFLDEIQDEWNRTALLVRFTLSIKFVIMGLSFNCYFRQYFYRLLTARFWQSLCFKVQLGSYTILWNKCLAICHLRPVFSDSSLHLFSIDATKPGGLAYRGV
jgi:hypothetical protein